MIRIANAGAFWGDRIDAAAELLRQQPDLDFITVDYLAEVSMSILPRLRERGCACRSLQEPGNGREHRIGSSAAGDRECVSRGYSDRGSAGFRRGCGHHRPGGRPEPDRRRLPGAFQLVSRADWLAHWSG